MVMTILSADSENREAGWSGRISAAMLGGTINALLVAMLHSIWLPGRTGLDSSFGAGALLPAIWVAVTLPVFFCRRGLSAWLWMITIMLLAATAVYFSLQR